jgi:hypothetical protein
MSYIGGYRRAKEGSNLRFLSGVFVNAHPFPTVGNPSNPRSLVVVMTGGIRE